MTMKFIFKNRKEVDEIVSWLNDNIAPGGECKFWLLETNGQSSFYSHDYNSWRLECFDLMGYATLTGLTEDAMLALKLTYDFKG